MRERPGQLALDFAQDAGRGRWASSEPPEGQPGARPDTTPQNGSYAAAVLDVRDCSDCGGALTPGDIGQNRALCVGCRKSRPQDLAAERSIAAGLAGKASKCGCLRWSITENGNGPRHCIKCSREI